LALPLLQVLIFYVGVNFNSFLLAFKAYDIFDGTYSFVGFENFSKVIHNLSSVEYLKISMKNAFVVFFCELVLGVPLSLFFSYYIYKKSAMYKVFKVLLFLPFIVSNITLVIMYKYFAEMGAPAIVEAFLGIKMKGLLSNYDTKFGTLLFFYIWSGFGIKTLIYSGSMSGISQSVTESVRLDGITPFKEFFYITLPMIYPTLTVFVVASVAGIFVNQMHVFSFYGDNPDDYNIFTVGYYLYKSIVSKETTIADYPYFAAFGLLLTFITVPATLLIKWLMEKFGPSVKG
jgi:ABC-type sugar transport system permease subunit